MRGAGNDLSRALDPPRPLAYVGGRAIDARKYFGYCVDNFSNGACMEILWLEARAMKCGTLWCWLLGHKLVMKCRRYEGDSFFTWYSPLDFCIRCGQPKPEITIHPDAVRKTDNARN